MTCKRHGLTMLSWHSVGTYQGNENHMQLSGNIWSQLSQHAQQPCADPGLKSEIDVGKLSPLKNKVCCFVRLNTPSPRPTQNGLVPHNTLNQSVIASICPLYCTWVWLSVILIVQQHTHFGGNKITGTENIGLTTIQWSFEPSLWPWIWTIHL